jgi:phage gp45-like
MIRAIIKTFQAAAGRLSQVTAYGHADELIEDRDVMQHYGFRSRPKRGAEGVVIRDGNHLVMIADDDRRYTIALEDGEVSLYTDQGDKVHIKRDGTIQVYAAHVELGKENLEAIINSVEFMALYNAHTQMGNMGFPTGVPIIPMTQAAHCSAAVKAAK